MVCQHISELGREVLRTIRRLPPIPKPETFLKGLTQIDDNFLNERTSYEKEGKPGCVTSSVRHRADSESCAIIMDRRR